MKCPFCENEIPEEEVYGEWFYCDSCDRTLACKTALHEEDQQIDDK